MANGVALDAGKIPHKQMRSKKRRGASKPPKPPGLSQGQVEGIKTRLRGADKYRRRAPAYIYPRTEDGRPAAGPPEARTFAASEYWIDEQIKTRIIEVDGVETGSYRVFDPGAVPSGQKRCKGCGRQTPPQLRTSSGHCDDCLVETQAARAHRVGMQGWGAEEQADSSRSSLIVMNGGVGERYAG